MEILRFQDRRNAVAAQWALENFMFRFNQIYSFLQDLNALANEVASLGPAISGIRQTLTSEARSLRTAARETSLAVNDATPLPPLANLRASSAGRSAAVRSIDQTLLELRDTATTLTRRIAVEEARSGRNLAPHTFGSVNDAVLKAHVLQAIEEGRLPATIHVSPTFNQPGRGGIDVWDSATGIGWDLTTATSRQVAGHERYLGQTMPDGTVIGHVRPLVYSR
jgi:hypothetical protein